MTWSPGVVMGLLEGDIWVTGQTVDTGRMVASETQVLMLDLLFPPLPACSWPGLGLWAGQVLSCFWR